jgi:3-oxoacyl-[acyl-carrier protein] reductase
VEALESTSDESWDQQIRVNLSGVFYLCREFARWQKCLSQPKHPEFRASILNVSSLAGVSGLVKFPGFAAYAASKAGVIGLSEVLASELLPQGILVNVVAPGATDTQMLREALPNLKTSTTASEVASYILDRIYESETKRLTGQIWSLQNV